MGNIYKSKAERLNGDPYIGVCIQALETLKIWDRGDYCTDYSIDPYIILAKQSKGHE